MHLEKPSACRGGAALPALDIWADALGGTLAWTLQRTTTRGSLETAAVDWAPEPAFQKQPASCHNRPPSVAGPQHIARCCEDVATLSAGEAAVKMQAGTSAGGLIGGFCLFRSPAPALTVSC